MPFQKILLVILPLLVSLTFLTFITENVQKSADYRCYETAAKAIIAGTNPYIEQTTQYIYSPLLAQLMVLLYQLIEKGLSLAHVTITPQLIWGAIFYFYQSINLY